MAGIDKKDEFAKAYESYSDAIYRHCYYRVFEKEKARELMQDCFMKTWDYVCQGKEIKNLRAFLYRVANNLVIDYSRRKKESSLDEMSESGFDPGKDDRKALEAVVDASNMVKLMDKIDPKYRQIILMRYVDDLTPKEIAEAIGENENVVSVRLHRGIKQMKEIVGYAEI